MPVWFALFLFGGKPSAEGRCITERFLSEFKCISKYKGGVTTIHPLHNFFLGKQHDKNHPEHINYALAFENALSSLEAEAHESDDPTYIITHTLKSACDFYGADWSGFLDVDLDLGLWTPFMWYNASPEDKTSVLVQEFESAEFLDRWITAMHNNQALFVPDVEEIKNDCPEEYELYHRLGIRSFLAVPVKPRPVGFLVVRNPTRYRNRSSMLQMLAFVILAIGNEKRLLDSVKLVLSPENIKNDTDIIINLFGELEIYTSQGTLNESKLKSPKISRVLAYMLLHRKKTIPPREIAEAIWPEEAFDQENPGKKMKYLIYRLLQNFGMISSYNLIESTSYGYTFNPELHIMTDLELYDQYVEAAHDTTSVIRKIDLLKKAIALYKGDILSSASHEHWLIAISAHYQMSYLTTLEELLHTLAEFRDYSDLHRCASRALQMNSDNLCALYWLIFATYLQGALCNAKTLLKEARMNLTKSEYEELEQRLKKTDGISLDFTGCEPLENK